ncbi:TPA: hypothetical protein N0F65_002064 [Lagenidium giganteum]|uniref:Uncharacterized protein n=1 Tax=Lagenidium giganteum TaxID=4803 RepID=A0AAV2ZH01_9STRA|nr:TPA: hypothetical protein N0F65_002064 [Lagenidium giganteum]
MTAGGAGAAPAPATDNALTLEIAEEPELTFRQLHKELHAFVSQRIDDDEGQELMAALLQQQQELLAPINVAPKSTSERQSLQANKVKVLGKTVDVSVAIQQEIIKLSDEYNVSEKRALELWFLASDAQRRPWVERTDQLGSISNSIPGAARHFFVSEFEFKLTILKDLLRLRLDERLEPKRRHFVITYTNELISQGLIQKIADALETQLPALLQLSHLQQSASYWHCLLADCLVLAAASTRTLPEEALRIVQVLKALCQRLNATLPKVSPHLVNLTAVEQLYAGGLPAGSSPEAVVKQVECILQAISSTEMAVCALLLQQSDKIDRETGRLLAGGNLRTSASAATIKQLHQLIFQDDWDQPTFQGIAMLGWAAFLSSFSGENGPANRSSDVTFPEVEQSEKVVKKAVRQHVFASLVEVLLKYVPDRNQDPVLFDTFQLNLELIFSSYSSKLMIDVPTLAEQASLDEGHADSGSDVDPWVGDCLENIIQFAATLCSIRPEFAQRFWPESGKDSGEVLDDRTCEDFLIACRDAAYRNPGCFSSYMRLVAAAASGPDCAQNAFHHVKQNPSILNWDHFFNVMNKYNRLLSEIEKPAGFGTMGGDAQFDTHRRIPASQRSTKPKELEALEMIQVVLQSVVRDPQLALIFFHNHEWAPVQTFVSLLQCKVPSSLKGALMKTLAIFARVPDIAPFVWRQVDSLQILRTTTDTTVFGSQDISFELEQYESAAHRYPATRGFVTLLFELFENPHVWNSLDSDGQRAAVQYYFDFLLERVFMKFDLRQYESEDEKWALVSGALAIFKKILRSDSTVGLHDELLVRFLSSSALVEKLLSILTEEGGVDGLENCNTDIRVEHAFFFCRNYVKKQTEKTHGSLSISDERPRPSILGFQVQTPSPVHLRERSVQLSLELLVYILERDVTFVESGRGRLVAAHVQLHLLHTILCHHRSELVKIIQYIEYSKNAEIAKLSAVILRIISNRLSGPELVDLILDSGSGSDIMFGYTNRLLTDSDDNAETTQSDESEAMAEFDGLSPSKKRKRSGSLSLVDGFAEEPSTSSSIRVAILDLLLENLTKPSPNLSQFILGVMDKSIAKDGSLSSGFDAIVALLMNPDFSADTPELAERCQRLLYLLATSDATSRTVLARLEDAQCDFFFVQLQYLASSLRGLPKQSAQNVASYLNMRGWFLKTLAVYIHSSMLQEPPHIKKVNRLLSYLLSHDEASSLRHNRMLLLQLYDETSPDILPPPVPSNHTALALAEQVTGPVDQGYFKWLKIDVERFCQELQTLDWSSAAELASSTMGVKRLRSNDAAFPQYSGFDGILQWAIQWNTYSERVAAESHALNSLRELTEVVVLDYLTSDMLSEEDTMTMWQGLKAVQSREVRWEIVSSICSIVLTKIVDKTSIPAQLFEVLSRVALLLVSQLRQYPSGSQGLIESRRRQYLTFVEQLLRAVSLSINATGNPIAARNARTFLYAAIVNVLSCLPSVSASPATSESRIALHSTERLRVVATNAVEVVCRDATDGDDVLSMALAVSALEAVMTFDRSATVKLLRERGFIVHFIGLFRRLSDMDASVDNGNDIRKINWPAGSVDAVTIGAMYESFLSLFTKMALSPEGAAALLEGGLLRALRESNNLPMQRPKALNMAEDAFAVHHSLLRLEQIFYRKWLPVVRVLSAVCSALPHNRTVASQLLQFIVKTRKLLFSSLKVPDHQRLSLNLLRETSYVSFILRYVIQFGDLCEKALSLAKWEKVSQSMAKLVLFYGVNPIPQLDNGDLNAQRQNGDWRRRVAPTGVVEERNARIYRFEGAASSDGSLPGYESLRRFSLFDEEKFYLARMILSNAAAFCSSRMMQACDDNSQLQRGRGPLLAISERQSTTFEGSFASSDYRAAALAADPLWSHSPTLSDFVSCLEAFVRSLSLSSPRVSVGDDASQALGGLIDFHRDSATFIVENVLIVLLLHFSHHFANAEVKAAVQKALQKVLLLVEDIEVRPVIACCYCSPVAVAHVAPCCVPQKNPFIHAVARKLRDVASP